MTGFGPKNPHPLSTLEAEFVWKGKYGASGERVAPEPLRPAPVVLPMEMWGAGRTRGDNEFHENPLPDPLALEEADLLLEGDNRLALSALLERHRGAVQMIYIDPPFAVGRDHTMTVEMGGGGEAGDGEGEPGRLAMVAYRDDWEKGGGEYLGMMYERLSLMRDLLSATGVLFLHCDWRVSHKLRLLLDDLFGAERFINEIVWHYYNKYSAGRHRLPRAHDTILVYGKGSGHRLKELRLPRETPQRQLVRENVGGVLRNARDADGRLRYRTVVDRKADDVWRIPQLQPASREWTGFATQKHHDLMERILTLASEEGDLVADFFSGSGTLLSVARRMGRRWIGCDMGVQALHTTRRRMLTGTGGLPGNGGNPAGNRQPVVEGGQVRPYIVAGLGRSMAEGWRREVFSGDQGACREFILRAFGAESLGDRVAGPSGGNAAGPARNNGTGAGHGALEGALCHVAAPEAQVGADRALSLARAARAQGFSQLHLLAWAFDPLFWDDLAHFGAEYLDGVKPYLIPLELAGPGGGRPVFQPFPRCGLEAHCEPGEGKDYRLTVRLKSLHRHLARPAWESCWQDEPAGDREPLEWVEGWALDPAWEFQMPLRLRWWSYRARKKRELVTEAGPFSLSGSRGRLPYAVVIADAYGCVTRHGVRLERPRPR